MATMMMCSNEFTKALPPENVHKARYQPDIYIYIFSHTNAKHQHQSPTIYTYSTQHIYSTLTVPEHCVDCVIPRSHHSMRTREAHIHSFVFRMSLFTQTQNHPSYYNQALDMYTNYITLHIIQRKRNKKNMQYNNKRTYYNMLNIINT